VWIEQAATGEVIAGTAPPRDELHSSMGNARGSEPVNTDNTKKE
jgi:hypothetical protein